MLTEHRKYVSDKLMLYIYILVIILVKKIILLSATLFVYFEKMKNDE